jgi:hypothetical protein
MSASGLQGPVTSLLASSTISNGDDTAQNVTAAPVVVKTENGGALHDLLSATSDNAESQAADEEEHNESAGEKESELAIVEAGVGGDGVAVKVIRRRKRILACPICKKMRCDGSVVHDGDACKGGHVIIDNVKKIWQCQQAPSQALAPPLQALPTCSPLVCHRITPG